MNIFFKYLFSYKKELFFIIFGIFLVSFSIIFIGKTLKIFVDIGLRSNYQNLSSSILNLFLFAFLLSFGSFIRSLNVNRLCIKLISKLKIDCFCKIVNSSNLENHTYTLEHNLNTIENLLSTSVIFTIRNSILFVASIVIIFSENPLFLLKLTLIIPLIFIPLIIFGRKIKAFSKKESYIKESISNYVQQNFLAIKSIKVFETEDESKKQLEALEKNLSKLSFKKNLLRSFLISLVILVIISYLVYLLLKVGQQIIDNQISSGQLVYLIFFSVLLASSFVSLADNYSSFASLKSAILKITELLLLSNSKSENSIPINNFQQLSLKSVSINFGDGDVIKNVSFDIKKGDFIAIVGATGSGKSSIFNAILGFIKPANGQVLINNISIENVDNYLSNFAFVPQDEVVFSTSLKNNITFGKEIQVDDIIQKLNLSHLKHFDILPKDISGGEKQRILIARAIAKNADILLLDEPTSSLDLLTEKIVKDILLSLKGKTTIIVIAHRLSTVMNADRIIVLDKGEIASIAKHSELINQNDFYKSLVALHFA